MADQTQKRPRLGQTNDTWETGAIDRKELMEYPRVGVAAIVVKNGRVLLIKRKNVHGSGSWSTPGGHLEFGETPEQCAIRETEEEVGIQIADVRFIAATNDIFQEKGKHYITLWMAGTYLTGEARIAADYEIADFGWFEWENLPVPLFLPFENLVNQKCYPPDGLLQLREKNLK
jgi:8-oxo-dGTP diphosphatase